jgi:hypothetical protein
MDSFQIPPKEREEWRKMITGEISHQYSNFVLQLLLSQARKDIMKKRMSMDEAVDKIYDLCSKYAFAVKNDVIEIFKTW